MRHTFSLATLPFFVRVVSFPSWHQGRHEFCSSNDNKTFAAFGLAPQREL